MKIISWGIIFVVVIFSFSFVNRLILNNKMDIMKEEVKYNNVLEAATADATAELRTQMSNYDITYEETQEMMLSVANKFFNSFSLGFGYYGGNVNNSIVKMYVPAISMMTHDGFYMYTLDYVSKGEGDNKVLEHTLKPEIKYSYEDKNGVKINFTLDNTVIFYKPLEVNNYFEPINEPKYTPVNIYPDLVAGEGESDEVPDTELVFDGYEQVLDEVTNEPVYSIKRTNTGKVVDLNHWYDIIKRDYNDEWEEKVGDCTFAFYKHAEADICYTTNEKYTDSSGKIITTPKEKVILYEKSFYTVNGIRYLLEEWYRQADDTLIEQRVTEYTDEQINYTQALEVFGEGCYGNSSVEHKSVVVEDKGKEYKKEYKYNLWETNGYVTREKNSYLNYDKSDSDDKLTYLTRGNPENEGFINPLTGEYQIGEFHKVRRELISSKIKENLEYYILLHNEYAQNNGITYTFTIPEIQDTDWENAITDMSVFAFVQGIPMVNGKYYNNYGVAGAKVIEQERFYGLPVEDEKIEENKIPTYYSSREIGQAKSYLLERNNAQIFYNSKIAADYGYYPNIEGSLIDIEKIQASVWNIDIEKVGFNCVQVGDQLVLPVVISDDVAVNKIKWAEGTKNRQYFASNGETLQKANIEGRYIEGSVVDSEINYSITEGQDINIIGYFQKGDRIVQVALISVGTIEEIVPKKSYTVYVQDKEGYSKVKTIQIHVILREDTTISQTSVKTDIDNDPENTISIEVIERKRKTDSNYYKNENGKIMMYYAKGKISSSELEHHYSALYNCEEVSGVNLIDNFSKGLGSFTVSEYGYYTVFGWLCTGEFIPPADVVILPQLEVWYEIHAIDSNNNIVAKIYWEKDTNTLKYKIVKTEIKAEEGDNFISYEGDKRKEIKSEIVKGVVYVTVNQDRENIEKYDYNNGEYTVDNYEYEIEQTKLYECDLGIRNGVYTFDIEDNNRKTVYIQDSAGNEECVLIDAELISKLKIPNFKKWTIPDINYQKEENWKADNDSGGGDPITTEDTSITFLGYKGEDATISNIPNIENGEYPDKKDIIFDTFIKEETKEEYEPTQIVFEFTIDENKVNYHSSIGAGFLYDCDIDKVEDGNGYFKYIMKSGYLILWKEDKIQIYKLKNEEDLSIIRHKDLDTNYFPFVAISGEYKKSNATEKMYRIEIEHNKNNKTSISIYEKSTDSESYADAICSLEYVDNYTDTQGSYGVVMINNADGHSGTCSKYSKFTFSNMSIIEKEY